MSGGVRDPAFWRRFSMAVHMDEEKASAGPSRSTSASSKQPVKQQGQQPDDWLERNRRKSRKSQTVGCLIAWLLILVIVAIVLVLLWLWKIGPFARSKG